MKIERNEQFNGLEVYFDTKPEQKEIDGLKKNGFRWHNVKKCWYAKETQERAFLLSLMAHSTEWLDGQKISKIKEQRKKDLALIDEAGKIYGRGNKKDEKYFSGHLFDAFRLEDGRILTIDKESIETRFCFGEHGYDYEEVLETERKSRCFEYFESENLEKLKRQVEEIEEVLNMFDKETNDKPTIYFFRAFWCDGLELLANWYICDPRKWASRKPSEFDEVRPATKEEIKTLLDIKKTQLEDKKRRCSTWWKKYGEEHLHTWTYWADA